MTPERAALLDRTSLIANLAGQIERYATVIENTAVDSLIYGETLKGLDAHAAILRDVNRDLLEHIEDLRQVRVTQ